MSERVFTSEWRLISVTSARHYPVVMTHADDICQWHESPTVDRSRVPWTNSNSMEWNSFASLMIWDVHTRRKRRNHVSICHKGQVNLGQKVNLGRVNLGQKVNLGHNSGQPVSKG